MAKSNAATVTNSVVIGGVVLGAIFLVPKAYAAIRKVAGGGTAGKPGSPLSDLLAKIAPKQSQPATQPKPSGSASGAKPPSDGSKVSGQSRLAADVIRVDTSISPSDLRPWEREPITPVISDFGGIGEATGSGTLSDSLNSILDAPTFEPNLASVDVADIPESNFIGDYIDAFAVDAVEPASDPFGLDSGYYADDFSSFDSVLPPDDSTDSGTPSSWNPYDLGDYYDFGGGYDGGDYWNDGGWDSSWNDSYGAYY